MKAWYCLIGLILSSTFVHAGCDPSRFRWGCNMYVDVVDKKYDNNLVYCGNTRLYVSRNQFAMLERYQRAGIHMHLMVNDVFFDGPCLPAKFNINHRRPNVFD
jgi:hypothetical protein